MHFSQKNANFTEYVMAVKSWIKLVPNNTLNTYTACINWPAAANLTYQSQQAVKALRGMTAWPYPTSKPCFAAVRWRYWVRSHTYANLISSFLLQYSLLVALVSTVSVVWQVMSACIKWPARQLQEIPSSPPVWVGLSNLRRQLIHPCQWLRPCPIARCHWATTPHAAAPSGSRLATCTADLSE